MAVNEGYIIELDEKIKRNPLDAEFVQSSGADNEVPTQMSDPKAEPTVASVPLHKLYKYASRNDLICIYVGILGAVVTGSLTILSTWIFGTLVDTMIALALTLGTPDEDVAGFWSEVELFIIYSCVLGLVMWLFSYLSIMLFNYAAHNQIFRIRSEFFKSVLSKDVAWFDVNQSGEFASRMNEDLSKLSDGIGEKIVMFVHFIATFLSSLIFALVMGWQLALVSLATQPITLIMIAVVSILIGRLSKREMAAYARAGVIAEEAFSAIRTVVSFGGEHREAARYATNLIDAYQVNIQKAMATGVGFGLVWFCIYGSYALSVWYGIGLVMEHAALPPDQQVYTAGTMLMVLMAALQAAMSLGQTGALIEVIGSAQGAAAKVFSVIEQTSEINSFGVERGVRPARCNGVLRFDDVHFSYPSREEVKVLQGVSLTIGKGEIVALVGTSGCGKSTIVQLAQRFYDPSSGEIRLDDRDIRQLDVNWLREHIGVVGQEPVLFSTTIAENIRYGFEAASQQDIERAAKASNAHNFIVRLPQGYNTLVGERGAQMSGGQKQRIAIARALIRNPEILLLDEATSALDAASESAVQKALEKAQQGRTTIIVAHRLSTIRNANRIVVLKAGRIVEQGDHATLMADRGQYYELVTLQTGSTEQDGDLSRAVETLVTQQSTDNVEKEVIPEILNCVEIKPKVSFRKVVRWNHPERWFLAAGGLASVLIGFAMPIFALVSGIIIQLLSETDAEVVRSGTNAFVIGFVIAGLVMGCAHFVTVWSFGIAGERLTQRLREAAFKAMLNMEMAWFDNKSNGTGTLCSRLSTDAAAVQGAIGQRIGSVVSSLSTAIVSIVLGVGLSWKLGLVTLAFTPILMVAQYYEIVLTNQTNLGIDEALERSTKVAVEVVSNIRTVIGLGRERMFNEQYIAQLEPTLAVAKRMTHIRGLVYGISRSLMSFANAACIAYGAHLVVMGEMSIAAVFVITSTLITGSQSIAASVAFAPNFTKGLTAAAKIDALVERQALIRSPSHPQPFNASGNVRFADADFVYASRPNIHVLSQLSLDILPGQNVGLVGASGCGKSTCFQLLVRFYDATAGVVELNGTDVRAAGLAAMRSDIGIVSQEPSLFDRTIAENIAYGDNSREVSRAEIIEAAQLANIHQFVCTLPLGYETRLGSKGTQLSGGQKQRIAIARALVRKPSVLLLDEATSALDMESEQVVQQALDAASVGRTCITIAHRLSTIVNSDMIFVVHDGRVVERGTHKDLLELHGRYYQMYALQTGKG